MSTLWRALREERHFGLAEEVLCATKARLVILSGQELDPTQASLRSATAIMITRRSTVLFRRGEKAFGVFLVIRGTVSLDFGVDASTALANVCGPGALVGLPATLSRSNYSLTATATEGAELGFLSPDGLVSLLRKQPELRQHVLTILSAKVAHSEQVAKALRRNEKLPELGLGPA